MHESRQDDDFDSDLFQVHDGNDSSENSRKRKMSEAKVLKLNTIEEEIMESKGVFEDALKIDENTNLVRLQS